ncbi:MAG: dihydrofolate reductase [Paramuribaculum sp.]|nr:dihydrofolate reductase [Paramuribaculum sp.]
MTTQTPPPLSEISVIAIVAADGAIGRGGDQPFHISADFKRFKQLTLGHPVIMGRRTFEALPKGALPGRKNIVITRNSSFKAENITTAPSIKDALAICREEEADPFIIGGGEIYRQSMSLATTLYLTEVEATVEDADTFFPEIDPAKWVLTERSEEQTDPRSGVKYRFSTYRSDTK